MRLLPLAVLLTLSLPAFSQDEDEVRPDMPISFPEIALGEGWKLGVDVGTVFDWDYNRSVTGIEAGHFLRFGGNLYLTATLLSGDHEWRNKLTFAEIFNLNPNIDYLVKSNDRLAFYSDWFWSFGRSWGSIVSASMETEAFPGIDYQDSPTVYHVTALDGTVTNTPPVSSFTLTNAFEPLYLREAVGLFARPVNTPYFTWELKASGYAMQAFANTQKKIVSQDNTGVTVVSLANFYQVGPAIGNFFFGEIIPKMFFYQIYADVGYSAYESSALNLNSDFSNHIIFNGIGSLTFKPAEWIALTWNVRGVYMPEVSTNFEIDNKFMLSFPFSS